MMTMPSLGDAGEGEGCLEGCLESGCCSGMARGRTRPPTTMPLRMKAPRILRVHSQLRREGGDWRELMIGRWEIVEKERGIAVVDK